MVEKTGYPQDMLDLDLDLEADLGVDTVKQAEMFAAIREIYNIPRDENIASCATTPRWRTSSGSCIEKRPDLAGELTQPTPAAPQPLPARDHRSDASRRELHAGRRMSPYESIKEKVLQIVAEKTAIPKTCWTWISISKPISASTPSSRRRCSPRCARPTTSRAMRT